jgi:hypothetical protein
MKNSVQSSQFPSRMVLKNVPMVNFYGGGPRCPEDIPFPSVMRAIMEYFNENDFSCRSCRNVPPGCKIHCSYSFFIGVSGVASFLNWKPGWEYDNVEIMYMSDDPAAPFEHAFNATGYAYQIFGQERDRELFRQQILESINENRPVLAFGPIGPPESGIITGYDEDGDVLVGWSFFQGFPDFNQDVEFEPTGEFRKRNWFNYPPGFSFIKIQGKEERPPYKEMYRKALEWMVKVAHTPITFGDRYNGLAAYDGWANHLLHDADFPDDPAILFQRHDVHNSTVGFVAEARWYGSQFLLGLTNGADEIIHRDAIEDLYHAAALYAGEHGLMWKLWDLAGGISNPEAWKQFADPATRRKMVPIIEEAKRNDEKAIKHIERVLSVNW